MSYKIARCPGVSSPIAIMVGMDVTLCSTCLRWVDRKAAQGAPLITPRLNNGCSHYIEALYTDFQECKKP